MISNKRHLHRTCGDLPPKAVGLDSKRLKGRETAVLCFIGLYILIGSITLILAGRH